MEPQALILTAAAAGHDINLDNLQPIPCAPSAPSGWLCKKKEKLCQFLLVPIYRFLTHGWLIPVELVDPLEALVAAGHHMFPTPCVNSNFLLSVLSQFLTSSFKCSLLLVLQVG